MLLDWLKLVRLTDEQLALIDVALINLSCAAGLPGSDKIDAALCVATLDDWARRVREYTERFEPEFRRRPEKFRDSEAYFRCLCLVTVLWRHCGVKYNEAKMPLDVPLVPEDSFIFGVIQGQGGTCASLPVVYAAVGRRLGYPIKLVLTRAGELEHLFARWDGAGEYLNVDPNSTGLICETDDDYRTGKWAMTPEVERQGCYLLSKTPRQELAGFLAQRGLYFREMGKHREAARIFAWALALHPENAVADNTVARVCNEWGDVLRALEPDGFPKMQVTWPVGHFPPSVPREYTRALFWLECWDNLLRDPEFEAKWWGPMRRGERLASWPARARIEHTGTRCEIGLEMVRRVQSW
jgi:hypothetical protein